MRQNTGIGRALLSFGLALADRQDLPVLLASSNPRNLPFYERAGFSLVGDVRIPGLPRMYPMLREPRAETP